tara:strand:+ start:597 stop:842 length:246 start_codon:yes stop_codon:yes gene_type:complete
VSPKVTIDDTTEYGYLWWLQEFKQTKSYLMSGNGGNKVLACPDLDLAVVITTTNYNNRNAHSYTDEIMGTYIIPALKQAKK